MMRHCLRDFICQYCVFIAIPFYCVSNGLFVKVFKHNVATQRGERCCVLLSTSTLCVLHVFFNVSACVHVC